MEKKVYSLNLMAYIEYKTKIKGQLYRDDKAVYAVYPEEAAIGSAINTYRDNRCKVNLHEYLQSFAELRNRIKDLE